MIRTCLLYIIIIIVGYSHVVLSHYNCSNVQPPSSSDSSSSGGVRDLQVIPLHYCIIDNCTIMRVDTGETLNIIYTTDGLMVVTPTDGQTSTVVTKNNTAVACLAHDDDKELTTDMVVRLVTALLVALVSGYMVLFHLLFEEVRNSFGNLIMFYGCALIFFCINQFIIVSFHVYVALNSLLACQSIMYIYMQGMVAHEVIATCILAYLAYILYCSVNVREITDRMSKELLKKCMAYVLISLGLLGVLILCYDFSTSNSKHLLLPDNHCAYTDIKIYNTLIIPICFAFLNKIFQMVIFIIYLYYFYKFIVISNNSAIPNINRELIMKCAKVAFVFGAAIGLAYVILILGELTGYRFYGKLMGRFLFILQQYSVLITMVCTKRTFQLCRNKFSSKIHPSA